MSRKPRIRATIKETIYEWRVCDDSLPEGENCIAWAQRVGDHLVAYVSPYTLIGGKKAIIFTPLQATEFATGLLLLATKQRPAMILEPSDEPPPPGSPTEEGR